MEEGVHQLEKVSVPLAGWVGPADPEPGGWVGEKAFSWPLLEASPSGFPFSWASFRGSCWDPARNGEAQPGMAGPKGTFGTSWVEQGLVGGSEQEAGCLVGSDVKIQGRWFLTHGRTPAEGGRFSSTGDRMGKGRVGTRCLGNQVGLR